jgi:hypothetical protein
MTLIIVESPKAKGEVCNILILAARPPMSWSVIVRTQPQRRPGILKDMHSAPLPATLRLHGIDWARYFAPVLFFGFLASLCLGLIAVSAFLVTIRDPMMVAAAGLFGLLATGAAGAVVLRLQMRWLRYTSIPISCDPETALAALRRLATEAGWRITRQTAGGLEARTPGTMFAEGERVFVEIRDQQVLVASICDPDVGFSLVGHQRCQQHCERVRQAVQADV